LLFVFKGFRNSTGSPFRFGQVKGKEFCCFFAQNRSKPVGNFVVSPNLKVRVSIRRYVPCPAVSQPVLPCFQGNT
jgi:hypothetical protein